MCEVIAAVWGGVHLGGGGDGSNSGEWGQRSEEFFGCAGYLRLERCAGVGIGGVEDGKSNGSYEKSIKQKIALKRPT